MNSLTKFLGITALAVVVGFSIAPVAFAQAPESDFRVSLTRDNRSVIIERYHGRATNVEIPATIQGLPVRVIGHNAFDRSGLGSVTPRLTRVVIPEGIIIIGDYAFSGQDRLTTIIIPSTVTGIGRGAFRNTGELRDFEFPQGVREIGESVLEGSRIRSFTWPAHITRIPDHAFRNSHIENIVIPEGVTHIGRNTFTSCRNLRSITLPSTIRGIGAAAFVGTQLTSITIPETVRSIQWAHWGEDVEGAFRASRFDLATQARLRDLGYTAWPYVVRN